MSKKGILKINEHEITILSHNNDDYIFAYRYGAQSNGRGYNYQMAQFEEYN